MIDDRSTCDVCGEEFNLDRPHVHIQKKVENNLKKKIKVKSTAKRKKD